MTPPKSAEETGRVQALSAKQLDEWDKRFFADADRFMLVRRGNHAEILCIMPGETAQQAADAVGCDLLMESDDEEEIRDQISALESVMDS